MPIIEHSDIAMAPLAENRRQRTLVSAETGAAALTIKEVELHPGYVERLHTHDVDVAVMVTGGAVQMVVGDEVRTVRAGSTMVAPPGMPHKLTNNLWTPVQLLVTYPTGDPDATYLE
jgi:quercetin dioxygenase-like cupin family protein